MDLAQVKTLGEFLAWLAGPGAVIVVLWALSWGLDKNEWWLSLDSRLKQAVVLVLSGIIGIGSVYLLSLPAEYLAKYAPYFKVIFGIGGAWLVTQIAHVKNPYRREG